MNFIKGPLIGWNAPKAMVSSMGALTMPQLVISAAIGGGGTDVLEPSGTTAAGNLVVSPEECERGGRAAAGQRSRRASRTARRVSCERPGRRGVGALFVSETTKSPPGAQLSAPPPLLDLAPEPESDFDDSVLLDSDFESDFPSPSPPAFAAPFFA